MQGDIREHKITNIDLCNPKMSLTQFYAGVSPKSSDGTEKGVGGGSANKSKSVTCWCVD